MPTPVCIRFMEQADLYFVLAAETALNTVNIDDPDFGQVEFHSPWAMNEEDFLSVISQRRNHIIGTNDTRTYALQITKQGKGESGQDIEVPWVCGAFSVEKEDSGFTFAFLTIHPEAPIEEVTRSVLRDVKGQADRSESRKRVTLYIRDQDACGFQAFISAARSEGFSIRLMRDYFGNQDGWECVYESHIEVQGTAVSKC